MFCVLKREYLSTWIYKTLNYMYFAKCINIVFLYSSGEYLKTWIYKKYIYVYVYIDIYLLTFEILKITGELGSHF